MGSYIFSVPWLHSYVEKTCHEYRITAFTGLALLTALHVYLRVTSYQKIRQTILLCHLLIKVFIMYFIEIFVFRFACGLWLDICIIQLGDATLSDRQAQFVQSPMETIFLYWTTGIWSYFIASKLMHICLDILRPGLISIPTFPHSYNCEYEDLLKDKISMSICSYLVGCISMFCAYAFFSLVTLFLPFKIIGFLFGEYLTKNCKWSQILVNEHTTFNEDWEYYYSIYLVILFVVSLVIYFQAFEKENIKKLVKNTILLWTRLIARMCGLESILLADQNPDTATCLTKPVHFKARVK